VTPELASEAAQALRGDVAATYARGQTVRQLVGQFGAQELFDGAVYRASARVYEGAWLDLRGLASALSAPDAPLLLQALHLVASLVEVPEATPLHLSTASVTRKRRPGERTFLHATFDGVGNVPDQLRNLSPRTVALIDPTLEARLRPALLARVRERQHAQAHAVVRAHLASLEKGLTPRGSSEPPGAAELRALERQIDDGDRTDLDERLDRLEAARGSTPAVRYLRARAALLRGEKPPRYVAQELSELAEIDHGFHEAALGAARSWLAAGEQAQARHFAHQVAEDPSATDSRRLVALEILEMTPETHLSRPPPAIEVQAELVAAIPLPPPPRFPWLGQMPPPTRAPPGMSFPPSPLPALGEGDPVQRPRAPRAPYYPELVESLTLPAGANESDLPLDATPSTPAQARVAMSRLARDLARDYRVWYGKTLRCDVMAIEAMQQHLMARFGGADIASPDVVMELRRHGALMSEVIARALEGEWIDVGPTEPGYWAMQVGSVRTYPIGRVYRFVTVGRAERDLVGHFLALDERARG